jgi:nicotinamidase-related amidase
MTTLPASVQRGFLSDVIESTTTTALRPYIGFGQDLGGSKGRLLFADSWNADIYPSLKAHVQPGDLHCAKNRMSGLWSPEQPLWKTLNALKKTTLLFTGVNTDQCVLGTFVDGYNAGWHCIMIDDCCGTTTVNGKEVSLYNVAVSYSSPLFG